MGSDVRRILLFDDDYQSMQDFKEHLEEAMGWQVELTAARGILDGLRHERFDLIVVDIMIHPTSLDANGEEVANVHFEGIHWRKTGIEFVARLRRGEYAGARGGGTLPTVPLLILSAVADFPEESWPPQGVGYLEKPFRLDELVDRLDRLLEE